MHLPTSLLLSGAIALGTAAAKRSAGCGKSLPEAITPGKTHMANFTSDGAVRSYRIHVPSSYDETDAVPVIFSFHGRSKTAKGQEDLSQFSNEKWNPNAIAIYPQGIDVCLLILKGPEGFTRDNALIEKQKEWQGDPSSKNVDDVAFTMNLLDDVESRYCVDRSRIYAAGKSNGGGFTNLLACDKTASTRIAAFAPVSGAYYQTTDEDKCDANTVDVQCTPGREKIPVLEFHGTADETIPYDGGARRGECLPSVPHMVREWAKRDGLGSKNETTELYDGKVQRYRFGEGGDDGLVTHYRIEGLGHAWPSQEPNGDNPDGTYLDATPLIMDFFKKWTL